MVESFVGGCCFGCTSRGSGEHLSLQGVHWAPRWRETAAGECECWKVGMPKGAMIPSWSTRGASDPATEIGNFRLLRS